MMIHLINFSIFQFKFIWLFIKIPITHTEFQEAVAVFVVLRQIHGCGPPVVCAGQVRGMEVQQYLWCYNQASYYTYRRCLVKSSYLHFLKFYRRNNKQYIIFICLFQSWWAKLLLVHIGYSLNRKELSTWLCKIIVSFLLIASAILISSWILLWRHLRPNRVSTCVQCVRNTSATSDIDDVFSNCPS